jgi:acyl-CoA thioesterase I
MPHADTDRERTKNQGTRKRILIITDSNAMPRDNLPYEDTWICMLKERLPHYDIIDRPSSGATTMRLVTEGGGGVALLEHYRPDTVILQMGLAECAPRLFRQQGFEHFLISRILNPYLRKRYIDFIRKHRGRSPDITYTSPEQFRSNLINYFGRAMKLGSAIIILLIPRPTALLISKSPHVKRNIDIYNNIYRETAGEFSNIRCIDPLDGKIDLDSIALDEIHLNHVASSLIAGTLEQIL